jgi:hypothetical protein
VYKPKLPTQAVPLPLPPPPVKLDKPQGCGIPERRGTKNVASMLDNKVAALQAYRKASGLCHFCVEKMGSWAQMFSDSSASGSTGTLGDAIC